MELRLKGDLFFVDFDTCQYLPVGMRYKKPTRLLTNAHFLAPLARKCTCNVHEVQLFDQARTHVGSKRQANLAAEYPPKLAAEWASLVFHACATREE